jgi:hypothetical protein
MIGWFATSGSLRNRASPLTEGGDKEMNTSIRTQQIRVALGFLLVAIACALPSPTLAAWVNPTTNQFQVGGKLAEIVPTLVSTAPGIAPPLVDPTCLLQGGTSLALVSGSKLAGVDPALYPAVLVVSCLGSDTARLNFVNPIPLTDGTIVVPAGVIVKQISTTAVPPNGWAYLVHRQDKGDLLGCGSNGALFSIDYSQTTATVDGTATPLTSPSVTSCRGLAWDADADVIYVGRSVTVGAVTTNDIVRFTDGATTFLGVPFTSPCNIGTVTNAPKGLAISGGVLLVSCEGDLTIRRIDKNTGVGLGVHGTLTATGLPPVGVEESEPGLSSLACDPVTFTKDATGKDLFTDALWSRRGGSVSALEFPAFTCGMPSNSVVLQGTTPYSPLAAGLGDHSGVVPGAVPRAACFDANGRVIDLDGDGLADCWESTSSTSASPGSGIDFDGDGTVDLQLCVRVNTNGDGVTLTTECAVATHKDLLVEIDWMQDHKPDPKALSQTQTPATLVNGVPVGVKSVREAFAAAPVTNPDTTIGIRIHFQVDEQVVFTPLFGAPTSHVNQVAFTPCTGPAINAIDPAQAVDFDTIKAANFGTATERLNPQALNAKRLAFRYVVFAHNLVGSPGGGSNGSGCAEIGGDDAVVTLGSFTTTTVNNISHKRGTTDQQAGTLMHEYGHNLGFNHGGNDGINCKPNYRSVMSYSRQFAGSPIPNRRLDYSRSEDPVLADQTKTGVLREVGGLDESVGLGNDPSLGPILPFFPSTDVIVFGPNAWSLQTPATAKPINWNRTSGTQTNASANINAATATAGCDGSGDVLFGHDDWGNVLYRASAAINFAGGETSPEMTSDNEQAFYALRDADQNGVGDNVDCGGPVLADGTTTFRCRHRMDTPKGIKQTGNFEVVIFSESNGSNVWNAPAQVRQDDSLTITLESVEISLKTKGNGTCAAQNFPDPTTGVDDGIKDLHCQVHVTGITLPTGTVFVIVSGFFFDPLTGQERAFSARQEVTIP